MNVLHAPRPLWSKFNFYTDRPRVFVCGHNSEYPLEIYPTFANGREIPVPVFSGGFVFKMNICNVINCFF